LGISATFNVDKNHLSLGRRDVRIGPVFIDAPTAVRRRGAGLQGPALDWVEGRAYHQLELAGVTHNG